MNLNFFVLESYHSEIRLRCTENMEDPQTGWSVITVSLLNFLILLNMAYDSKKRNSLF